MWMKLNHFMRAEPSVVKSWIKRGKSEFYLLNQGKGQCRKESWEVRREFEKKLPSDLGQWRLNRKSIFSSLLLYQRTRKSEISNWQLLKNLQKERMSADVIFKRQESPGPFKICANFPHYLRKNNTQKTVSLNQRNISLNWRKFCWFKKMFFNVNKSISLDQRKFFWINKTFFNSKEFFLWPYIKEMYFDSKKCFLDSKKLFSQCTGKNLRNNLLNFIIFERRQFFL